MDNQAQTYFVVTRDKRRVSGNSHTDRSRAVAESKYWQRIVERWQCPTKVAIVATKDPRSLR